MITLLAAAALASGTTTVIERPAPMILQASRVDHGPAAGCVLIAERATQAETTTLSWICPGRPTPRIIEWARIDRPVRGVAIEPQAAGTVSVLVGLDGAIDRSEWRDDGTAPTWRRLLTDDDLGPQSMDDRPDLDRDGSPDLLQVTFDGLRAYRASDDQFLPLWSIELPGAVQVLGDTVVAWNRSLIAHESAAQRRFTRPIGMRDGRVRLSQVELAAGPPRVCEIYLRNPTELAPQSSAILEGPTPRIAFTSLPGRKLEIFGEHWINVASLSCDSTGRGTPLSFSLKTPLINWATASLVARDLTGDSTADLVLGGSTGRLKPKPMIAVYPAIAGGSFARKPLTWEPGDEVEKGELLDDTHDYDGDGSADLVAVGERDLYLYTSANARRSSLPWNDKPAAVSIVPKEWGQAQFIAAVDLDQDGTLELLLQVDSADKSPGAERSALLAVDFTPNPVTR
ncbi:MAG: VCBS repeat-containing protein [Acidobacteriota bacterium]